MLLRKGVLLTAAFLSLSLASSFAQADVQHVVGKGHTLEAIAHRYKVSVKSILDANKDVNAKHLHVGDVLTIPKVDAPKKKTENDSAAGKDKKAPELMSGKEAAAAAKAKSDKDAKDAKDKDKLHSNPVTFAAKPKTPGVIHIKRLASTSK